MNTVATVAILCVDDDANMLAMLLDVLRATVGERCLLTGASDAESALQTLRGWLAGGVDVPVVLTDYHLPVATGADLLREVHQLSPLTRKILLTAYADGLDAEALAEEMRLYRFMPKPWVVADMRVTVREAVQSYFQEQRLRRYVTHLETLQAHTLDDLHGTVVPSFIADMQTLTAIGLELTQQASPEQLFRRVVELGRTRLGLDRLALFTVDDQHMHLQGLWGTDTHGNLRDESDYVDNIPALSWVHEVTHSIGMVKLWPHAPLMDYNRVVGEGWVVGAAIRDGERILGYLAADNLLTGRAPRPHETELLSLFGATIGQVLGSLQARHAARQSQTQYRTLVRHLPGIGVLLFDHNLRFVLAEGPFLQDHGFFGLEGRTLYEVMPPETARKLEPYYAAVLRGEYTHFEHEEEGMQYEADGLPILDEDGGVRAGMVVLHDISDHKQIEHELRSAKNAAEAANRAKSTFLANMSHELRTPLNAILGFAQLILQEETLEESLRKNVETITRSGEHLLQLINDVLDMSRIEAGRIQLDVSDFDLHDLLDGLHDMFDLVADNKNLRLLLMRGPDVPRYMRGDARKLRQVLINLLSNAIKFTDAGRVQLLASYEAANSWLTLVVQDTGRGIAQADLPHLFDAFTQTETTRDIGQGTGLGLAITRAYVQLMNGQIHVQSTLGVGSRFTVRMPMTLGEADALAPTTSQRTVLGLAAGTPTYNLLVVDDNLESRQVLEAALRDWFAVRTATNGPDAIALVQQWQPDLIFMDMRMAGMNGLETTRHIRALPGIMQPVILAFTANPIGYDYERVREAGCDDLLAKPASLQQVYAKLSEYLGVQFRHADDTARLLHQSGALLVRPAASAWRALSPQQRAALRHNALIGDLAALRDFVDAVRAEQPELATFVAQCLEQFEFEVIINALDGAAVVNAG